MNIFKSKDEKEALNKIKKLEEKIESLTDEKLSLHEKVETLKVEKKTSEEDIKHMMKKKEEMLDIKFQKKEVEIEKKKAQEVADVKDQYRDKLETYLEKQINDGNKRYEQILERLPNVNARLQIKSED